MTNRRLEAQHDEVIRMFREHAHVKRSRIVNAYSLSLVDYSGFQYRLKQAALKAIRLPEPLCIIPVLWTPDGKYSAWWTGAGTDVVMLANLIRHENNEIALWEYKAELAQRMQLAGPYTRQALALRKNSGGQLLKAIVEREFPNDPVVKRIRELEAVGLTWGP